MFGERYDGNLVAPGLTHVTLLSEEAASVNYAFETTLASALSCAYPLDRYASAEIRDQDKALHLKRLGR